MTKPRNPFTVVSPEQLAAHEAKQLFVEVFEDFPQIKFAGNAIMFGARGSGKSMMLRCMLPDVQMDSGSKYGDLDYLSFLISIKNTELKITELDVLERKASAYMINEHFFVLTIMVEVLKWLSESGRAELPFDSGAYTRFHEDTYLKSLKFCRYQGNINHCLNSSSEYFRSLYDHAMCEFHGNFKDYIFSLPIEPDQPLPKYSLPLFTYSLVLCPFLKGIRDLIGMKDKNVYLFIDDADNLSLTQTKILNSWIITRNQPTVSLKVSTQTGGYKSFLGTNGVLAETPHDYHEVRISERYTNSKHIYFKRVRDIVCKRLEQVGICDVQPEKYFPPYKKQEDAIVAEGARIRSKWALEGSGYRPSDDVLRYARPNYIRDLGGDSKSRSTYMYAGFEQLVHLSSGVIRNFLDAAASMYEEESDDGVLRGITHTVQDRIMLQKASAKMFSEFPKLEGDFKPILGGIGVVQKLQNLVFAMGKTFHEILVSDLSERRVFSIALSNAPDAEIREVFKFGVQTGYFHEASVGNKNGTGKTWLYILNRMLAPQFTLDPNGFAGYLFVTNDAIRAAMYSSKLLRDVTALDEPEQIELFE